MGRKKKLNVPLSQFTFQLAEEQREALEKIAASHYRGILSDLIRDALEYYILNSKEVIQFMYDRRMGG